MKRVFVFVFCLIAAVSFISCGKKAMIDDCGCYLDLDDAQKAAQKKNQDILVIITSDGDDYFSGQFIDTVIKSSEFKSKIASKYSVFHTDFSQKSYEKTVVRESESKAKQKYAEEYAVLMQTGFQFACLLDFQYTPTVFLLTKDRFVISEVEYEDEILHVDSFAELLKEYDEVCAEMNKKVFETTQGTDLEQAVAIDKLYNETPETYRPLMLNLAKKIPALDKNNETGLCSPYIVAAAEAEAISHYSKGDLAAAVQCYVSAANDKRISAEEIQECYYMAAYLVASSGSDDYQLIAGYLARSLDANSEGEKVPLIKNAFDYYSNLAETIASEAQKAQ